MLEGAELRAWRKQQRETLAAARSALSPGERRKASSAIESQLEELLGTDDAEVVGVYWPIRGEFDIRPLVARLRERGLVPALPVVLGKGQPLEFRVWDRETPLARGPFDLAHPARGVAVEPGLLIVPLLGFDDAGFRLGYGAGYYDITLAARRPRTIGVGFELGRLPTIYPQPHDIPMDAIVTESGVRP